MSSELKAYDLTALADNGLRRGRTTGSCAAAAVKAALQEMYAQPQCLPTTSPDSQEELSVAVTLPDLEHFLLVPVQRVYATSEGMGAEVVKFAGDDPDQTDGAIIFAEVRVNGSGSLRFLAGAGVGIVTAPGIRVPVGEPAINPGPRQMIRLAIEEVLDGRPDPGFDVVIGCRRGEEISKRTFNPRLGIVGGISILGTTGIVEPMSLSAYKAAIEVYIRVALAEGAPQASAVAGLPSDHLPAPGPRQCAYLPGNLGISMARSTLQCHQRQIVHIANFIGFAFETTEAVLAEENRHYERIWLLGHPGKIAKILDGHWDTHSQRSPMALPALARVGREIGLPEAAVAAIAAANTAEALVELLPDDEQTALWNAVSKRAAAAASTLMPRVGEVCVQLFDMSGHKLGEVQS